MVRALRWITVGAALVPALAGAQTRAWVTRLGADTARVERVVRTGDRIDGTIVSHIPATAVLKYSVRLNADGSVASYEQGTYRADGTPMPNSPQGVQATGIRMTFADDSVTRAWTQNGQAVSRHHAVPKGTVPNIPLGSHTLAELELAAARVSGGRVLVMAATSPQDNAVPFEMKLVSADSAELIQQGFRTGFRLDRNGRVTRTDGSLTTQKFISAAVADVDVAGIATAWATRDAAGQAVGVASTRDTARTTLGGATITIDYGRPAKRGRELWGALVPFDTVWRFGANAAAQLRTDKDIEIAGTGVPAGAYTIWLFPSKGKALLVVSKKTVDDRGTPLWGTMYDPTQDLARIPLETHAGLSPAEERWHVFFQGDMLMMHWGDAGYGVRVRVP
jgi:hypothetical protein